MFLIVQKIPSGGGPEVHTRSRSGRSGHFPPQPALLATSRSGCAGCEQAPGERDARGTPSREEVGGSARDTGFPDQTTCLLLLLLLLAISCPLLRHVWHATICPRHPGHQGARLLLKQDKRFFQDPLCPINPIPVSKACLAFNLHFYFDFLSSEPHFNNTRDAFPYQN